MQADLCFGCGNFNAPTNQLQRDDCQTERDAPSCNCGQGALFAHRGRHWCRECGRKLLTELARHRQLRLVAEPRS